MKTRIAVPEKVRKGEIVEVKTLASHPMESGFRLDSKGSPIPRNIITQFTCHYLGNPVFEAEFGPGIAANPFLSFFLVASETGELNFSWIDQQNQVTTENRRIEVVG